MNSADLPDALGESVAASLAFDRLASARGDGLLPEFRRLFADLDRVGLDGTVAELARYRIRPHRQSGPHPQGQYDPSSTPGVLPFPDTKTNRHQQRAQQKRAGKEA